MNNSRIEKLKQYLAEEPNDPFNLYALGTEYLSLAHPTALFYFEKLLLEHPQYLATYYQLGKLYQSLGQTTEAISVFEKGISLAREQQKTKTMNELRSALNEILDEEL